MNNKTTNLHFFVIQAPPFGSLHAFSLYSASCSCFAQTSDSLRHLSFSGFRFLGFSAYLYVANPSVPSQVFYFLQGRLSSSSGLLQIALYFFKLHYLVGYLFQSVLFEKSLRGSFYFSASNYLLLVITISSSQLPLCDFFRFFATLVFCIPLHRSLRKYSLHVLEHFTISF